MAASTNESAKVRRVPIRERSFTMGNVVGVNGYRVQQDLLKQRFAEGGYQLDETPHFLVFSRAEAPSLIVVHWFAPDEIDANIGDYFVQELKPLGILTNEQDFGNLFGAAVFSLFPYDPRSALHHYGTNTFHSYQKLLNNPDELSAAQSTIHSFARLYQRVCQLLVGQTFLDVGCSFGFLPLLVRERKPLLTHIIGVDIETSPFSVITTIAEEQHLPNVTFEQADVLTASFSALGRFDTVVALHVLEHLAEKDMYRALANLLQVTARRLIIAVPYEGEQPEVVYGHEQLFDQAKLKAIGDWCLQHMEGAGRIALEDCAGGLLLVERDDSSLTTPKAQATVSGVAYHQEIPVLLSHREMLLSGHTSYTRQIADVFPTHS